MKIVSTILLLLVSFNFFAQYGDLGIRQKFDVVWAQHYIPKWNGWNPYVMYYGGGYSCDDDKEARWHESLSAKQQDYLGSSLSGSLDALLVMYETTCDREYLRKFMRRTTQVQNARADDYGYSTQPYWFKDQIPWHGRLLVAFAHFVRLVEENSLEQINIFNDLNSPNYPSEYAGYTNYGDYANWLNMRNRQVMDFLLPKFWRNNNECMCQPQTEVDCFLGNVQSIDHAIDDNCWNATVSNPSNGDLKSIEALNLSAPIGSALIYMYLSNPGRTDYGVKAVEMARAYLIEDGGIFDIVSGDNAYTWYHSGWQQEYNGGTWEYRNSGVEDIGHATWDLQFPLLYSKYYDEITGTITGNQYFEDYQMVRFRNTFTRLVYDYDAPSILNTYNDGTTFHINVDGDNDPTVSHSSTDPEPWQPSAKYWINLCKFDNTNGAVGTIGVYDILMQFYDNVEVDYPASSYDGPMIRALAELCAANYAREGIISPQCVSGPNPPNPPKSELVLVLPNPALLKMKFVLTKPQVKIERVELRKVGNPNIGKIVDLNPRQKEVEIDLVELPSGHYIALITDGDGDIHSKLVYKE